MPVELSLKHLKHKLETVTSCGVPSPSEPKSSKPPEEKRKKSNNRRKRLHKIIFNLHQFYHIVDAIDFSIQELVYEVINAITIMEAISKEKYKFLDMK